MHSEATELTTLSPSSASRARMRSALSGLLTANDVAKELGMSQGAMRGLVNAREIEPLGKLGAVWVFWKADVEALKARRDQWRLGKRQK